MKRTPGLLLLLSLLLLVESSCSGSPSQRHPVKFVSENGTKITCYEPLADVITKGVKADVEIAAVKIGTLLKGTGGTSVDVERIRQEVPVDVSAFEAIDFRLCLQYVNGVLSKEEYHAFTKQIIPAYKKNPPEQPVPYAAPVVPPNQAQTCGPSLSTTIKPAIFVPQWVSVLNRMREERNTHDLINLMSVWGRTPVGRGGTELIDEALFTLNCLEKQGQLKMEKLDPPNFIGLVENKRIIFLKPMMTIPE
jgi:hypothetical protein